MIINPKEVAQEKMQVNVCALGLRGGRLDAGESLHFRLARVCWSTVEPAAVVCRRLSRNVFPRYCVSLEPLFVRKEG